MAVQVNRLSHRKDGTMIEGDDAVTAALTSKHPMIRIMARGAIAAWAEAYCEWINEEMGRPKADPVDVLQAMAMLQVQTFASIAAQVVHPTHHQRIIDRFLDTARDELPKHMAQCQDLGAR